MQKKPTRRDCFIPGCSSQMGQVVFMSAYKSDGLQRWWSQTAWAQKRKNKQIPKNSRVCEKHFEEKYIDRSYKMPRLFTEAWPTMHVNLPNPVELIGRYNTEKSNSVRAEVNPRIYCRLCGKKDKRPLENQLDQLKDGEAFLKFCLGQYYSKDHFPQGICENCMETAEYVLNFVKQCEQTQRRLDGIFVAKEFLKTEPSYEFLEDMKQENDDGSDYVDQPGSPEVLDVKQERPIPDDVSEDEDFVVLEDDRVSSDSQQYDECKPNVTLSDSLTIEPQSSHAKVTYESDMGSDSDDEPVQKRHYRKKPGQKPKKNAEYGNTTSEIVDDFPVSDQESESEKPTPQLKSKRVKSTSGAGETSRICPICGKILVHKGNFTSHLKIHSDKKDYVCNICGKQYYIRRELQMHIESLHEKKTFVCNICGIKCAWRKGLQRHMKNKHSDESSLKHKCTYCGKAFLLPNQLRLHVMKHTGDRITCEICGAGYRFNYMLTQHKMREHGMEFKGVKLYKTSSRSRKTAQSKLASEVGSAVATIVSETQTASAPSSSAVQTVDTNHDSLLSSSESSQSQHIQQQQQPVLHHQQLQQYHHVTTAQLDRVHYPAGFIYSAGGSTAMMLPPGSYNAISICFPSSCCREIITIVLIALVCCLETVFCRSNKAMILSKICRLCLSEKSRIKSIFRNYKREQLLNFITEVIRLDVSEGDGLPANICTPCANALIRMKETIRVFRENERKLRDKVLVAEECNLGLPESTKSVETRDTDDTSVNLHDLLKEDIVLSFPNLNTAEDANESSLESLESLDAKHLVAIDAFEELKSTTDKDHDSVEPESDLDYEPDKPRSKCKLKGIRRSRTNAINKGKGKRKSRPSGDEQNRPKVNDHKCYICRSESMGSAKALLEHLTTHLDRTPYTCTECKMVTVVLKSVRSLNVHMKMHAQPMKCEYCDRRYCDDRARDFHVKTYHLGESAPCPSTCDQCGKVCKSIAALKSHVRDHRLSLECDYCGKIFHRRNKLREHVTRVHEKAEKYECSMCHRVVHSLESYNSHLKMHMSEKTYECDLCPMKFYTAGNLGLHKKIHSGNANYKPHKDWSGHYTVTQQPGQDRVYTCKLCGKSYTKTVMKINNHLKNHFKDIKCDRCELKFVNESQLKTHYVVHTGIRQYKCDFCGKDFLHKNNLTQHLKLHRNEQNYACEFCGKLFTYKEGMKAHIRNHHLRESPYECTCCRRKFVDNASLTRHIAAEHEEPPKQVFLEPPPMMGTVPSQVAPFDYSEITFPFI
ncbi:uncharacterized protein LOC131428362 [Malaya genurostris]|uniref:uncharacterized protein LOC131428362 n=1 Tax=Malaya genurostris TaxID=325434 RepID=UPI0026F3CF00|nr:uncharacterized protein LOC131428362 [Malaya genurostris]